MQNTFVSLAPNSAPIKLWFLVLILALATTTACIVDEDTDPQIVSMSVTPSQISRSEAGTAIFTATIQVANFDEDIADAQVEVYIVSPMRVADPEQIELEGETIILSDIGKSWFGGLEPGVYNIGALVETDTVTIRENNVTTVTITD